MNTQAHTTSTRAFPASSFTPPSGLLQRKCACGGSSGMAGTCAGCESKTLQARAGGLHPETFSLPPIVLDGLRSTGQPLEPATRAISEPRFGHDFSRVRVQSVVPPTMQTKLTVGEPGNEYERDADRVADQVMGIPDHDPGGPPRHPVEPAAAVQRHDPPSATPEVDPDLEARIHNLKSAGHPLPTRVRAFFESRFLHDFSQVRLHTDARAAHSARELGARAFTVGPDIAFGAGQYAPTTPMGRHLLAHELAHVVQQRRGASLSIRLARLRDFNDTDNTHDPSKLTEAQIEATDEFKSYMDSNLIWQWKHKVTREEALLACRLILREIRGGAAVAWERQARDFMLTARSQLGTLRSTEKLVGKLEWVGSQESEFKSPGTAKSAFARWLLAGGPEPTDTSKMNCWEMIMFGAFQGGIVGKTRLQTIYEEAAKQSGLDVPAEVEKNLCRGSTLTLDPKDPKSPEPLPGDIVIFSSIANHAAISLGTKNASGEHEVISHWTPPNFSSKVKKTTIEKLLPHAGVTTVKFCTSAW